MRARCIMAPALAVLLSALSFALWNGNGTGGALAAEVRNPTGVAVIVGNKDYAGGVGEVAYAHRDAEAFRRYVVDVLGFDPRNVRVLNDATLGQMRSELGTESSPGIVHRFVERYRRRNDGVAASDVVVFYSGHGMPSLDLEQPGAYMLPVDADPHDPERNGYSVDLLYRVLGKMPARSVRVFLDACFLGFSGDGQQIVRGSPAAVTRLPENVGENAVVFTAAKANQIAYWDDEAGHGMFTHHVLNALYGGGDTDGDGRVTAEEVSWYLDDHLWRAVLETRGREQDAVLLDGTGTGATVMAAAPADGAFPARPRLDAPDAGRGGNEQAGGGDDGKADPARIVLADGYTVADWALLAELRLERGEHTALLAEANRHIRTHGPLAPLEEIRERAVAGLLAAVDLSSEVAAREALTRLAWIAASAGERADVLRLQARAHRRLGDHASAAGVYERWLQVAAQSHPERREILLALTQARRVVAESERFAALLGRPFSPDEVEESVGWTDLHYAALLNLPAVVAALIDAGMAADVPLKADRLPFGDDLQQTLAALEHGEAFKGWYADGETPLMIAAVANAREAAEFLVARGAHVDAEGALGDTPLHYAAHGNARETAEFLIAKGADIKATDNHGSTPLHEAARGNAREMAEWLVARGADIEARNNNGNTPLHWAARQNARKTAEFLVAQGADIEAKDNDGNTPLHETVRRNGSETAEFLLAKGADIEARNNWDSTPLHWAAYRNARETAAFLLTKGADIKATDNVGETPLHKAAWQNARETAEFLLAKGADIKAKDNDGNTSLHEAAYGNARETAEWLVEKGVDVQVKSSSLGSTPLHDAAWGNSHETVEWLVARGADINATTNGGETPLDYALRTTNGDEESRAATQALLRRLGGKTAEELK